MEVEDCVLPSVVLPELVDPEVSDESSEVLSSVDVLLPHPDIRLMQSGNNATLNKRALPLKLVFIILSLSWFYCLIL